ncbi:acyltransferase family protein [Cryobacterium suzukii]|nr:acyltransferase family protein [Cryobacterium suzukii]
MHRDHPPITRSGTRPEIQALRALAVGAVVLYHLWPNRLTGGYIGVDVFFAISGFLIIGHLLREVDRTGRVSLLAFWAKRARRLLPASLVVLVATGIGILAFVPTVQWQQWFREIAASALYVQNWQLAHDAVDYLGAENAPSPVQHFWSLSVEEQLYIGWPLIVIALVILFGRRRSPGMRIVTGAVLAILTLSSFVWSVAGVGSGDPASYFVTTSRAWEFGAGGLLAYFAQHSLTTHVRLRSAVSWLGLLGIILAVVSYTPATPFPGIAALLPVLSTLAVIWAGMPSARWSPAQLLQLRPIQWLGDISYSVYLWHWPLIVLLPHGLGRPIGLRSLAAALALTVLLAWLTKVLVEDPVRQGRFLVSRPAWVSIVSTLTASAVVVGACGFVYVRTAHEIADSASAVTTAVAEKAKCVGAPAAINGCATPFAITALTEPTFAATDIGKGVQVADACKQTLEDPAVIACEFGDLTSPQTTVALVGDSHAGHFLEAMDLYGASHNTRVISYLKTWCAGTGAEGVETADSATAAGTASCGEWGARVRQDILAKPEISTVVFSSFTSAYATSSDSGLGRTIEAADYSSAWTPLIEAGREVVSMVDVPTAPQDIPACIAAHFGDYDPCAFPESASALPDSLNPMLAAANATRVRVIDLRDIFCTEGTCHAVIGGLVVYFGNHHLTATFSRTLADILGDRVATLPENG